MPSGLKPLRGLYAGCQAKPEEWGCVYEATKDYVQQISNERDIELNREELIAVVSFVYFDNW